MDFGHCTNLKRKAEFKKKPYLVWKREAAERQKIKREEVKRIVQQKILAKEEIKSKVADEACVRIMHLPEELKIHILHHLAVKQLELLHLPPITLRAVLQVQERDDRHAKELIKSTWLPRLLDKDDKISLFKMAKIARLVPNCPVVKPSSYWHRCESGFCAWFAPEGGWDVFHAKNHVKCGMYHCVNFD